jgi:hypothetical protein
MNKIVIIIISLILFLLPCSVLAEGPVAHEDPDEAKTVFSGIALLQYYSGALDSILRREPENTQITLEKMPFANVPSDLEEPTAGFADSGTGLSFSIQGLYTLWQKQNDLLSQYQLDAASQLGEQIKSGLPEARQQLWQLTYSAESTGSYLHVVPSPLRGEGQGEGDLDRAYSEITDKIRRLGEMLDLFSRPLLDLEKLNGSFTPDQIKEILDSGNIDLLKDLLQPTTLTLEASSGQIFVGDPLSFHGILTSREQPLGNREIQILLNTADYLTVSTDPDGRFQGQLQVPYWYIPELQIQAIYYPLGEDAGVYLGSSSPVIIRNILYYQSTLALAVKTSSRAQGDLEIPRNLPLRKGEAGMGDPTGVDLVYPGQPVAVTGHFDYREAPPIDRLNTGLSLDDALMASFAASPDFSREIELVSDISPGKHVINVSVPASGRYAPVNAAAVIEIVQAAITADLKLPGLAFVPLSLGLSGHLTSVAGPPDGANINIDFNGTRSQAATSPDGSFNSTISLKPGLSLLGSQKMTIHIQPREPWNAPLYTTHGIFVINLINCGLILVLVLVLGVYLPRRLVFARRSKLTCLLPTPLQSNANVPSVQRTGYGVPGGEEKDAGSGTGVNLPDQELPDILLQTIIPDQADTERGQNVLSFYRLALKFVQHLTRTILKPQQTLREYALENREKLGPVAQLFIEFTSLVERLLYSRHKSTGEDLERSRRLSDSIQREAK